MSTVRFLHAADLHLDSAFEGLRAGKAVIRRGEQRQLLQRMAALVQREQLQFVLLSGDLLDSDLSYAETGEALCACLRQMAVPVFIAPGNHDYYSTRSPYARLALPENVHIFKKNEIESVLLPDLGLRVYGAAFTAKDSPALLPGFHAAHEEGVLQVLCLHGEVTKQDSPYAPIHEEELAQSGLHYAALGHIHKASGLQKAGNTWYSWPGCPEGRGFDEAGEKTVNLVSLNEADCQVQRVSIALRRYECLDVNVTGVDPLLAIHSQLGDNTAQDIYRITLTGEVDTPPDLNRLQLNISDLFYALQLRDETRLRRDVWEKAGEDSLRGLFLKKLRAAYDAADSAERRQLVEQAARWGLAALDHREEVIVHDDF
ncbi:MAG: DNA repair exonuclease [Oscillospiraceae bacterium]|nr:DNA repair exonuclease [Oscillospiraceae bacterium]